MLQGLFFSLFPLFEIYKQNKRAVLLALPLLLPTIVWFIGLFLENPRWEQEGNGGRFFKYKQGLDLIFDSPTSMLFGGSPALSQRLLDLPGIRFSDNAFLQMGVSFGFVFMLLYYF